MKRTLISYCCALPLILLASCTQADKREADEKVRNIDQKLRNAVEDKGPPIKTNTAEAGPKLEHAGQVAKETTIKAGQTLDHAATIARVKTKLAADVGLSAASTIVVDVSGSVVTLRGTASSEDQKRAAEQAVSRIDGITRVVNQIAVH